MSQTVNLYGNSYDPTPAETNQRALFGGFIETNWRQALIARGFGWHFDVGAFSTPVVGGGNGTVLDQDQPEFCVSVASGYTLIPVRINVACQTPLIAADSNESEIVLAVDKAAAYAGDGTVTLVTPINMRTSGANAGLAASTQLTCFKEATGNITNPTLGYELAHKVIVADDNGTPANALWGQLDLLYEPNFPPYLVGPCALYGYFGGTAATTGFASIDVIVVPSTLVSSLI